MIKVIFNTFIFIIAYNFNYLIIVVNIEFIDFIDFYENVIFFTINIDIVIVNIILIFYICVFYF